MLPGALILALMLLAVGALLVGFVCLTMAKFLLSPPRMTDGAALWILKRIGPDDLGLPWEEIAFQVLNERTHGKLKIAAWWIPAISPSTRCAVIVHGYADAKIGGIAWAPRFPGMGYNVLPM